MPRTNANTVTRIIWHDGTETFETHRASFGGFLNMLDRIANANGMPGRRVRVPVTTEDGGNRYHLANGRTFTIQEGWSK